MRGSSLRGFILWCQNASCGVERDSWLLCACLESAAIQQSSRILLELVLSKKQQVVEETEASRKIDGAVKVQMNGTIKPLYHLGVAYKGWCSP